ncbi:MAG: MATE family efflux transporter, partial [Bryobacteraceae bacterium]|nr:MATE family efflux transporter [Bryobacteraceae bacterium]
MDETAEVQESAQGFWEAVRESLRGGHHDFTKGSLGQAIWLLAIPMVLEMSMESLFGIVDVFWVGRLGSDAIATVGLTESLLTLVFAVAMGLSMAATAMVARRIGEGDQEGAAVAAVQAIAIGVAVAAVVGVAGAFFAPELLGLLGASPQLVAGGWEYTAIILGGNLTIMLLFLINAVFRGAGDAAIAMRVLWIGNICNMILDPCLIFGWGPLPELGLAGAAIATTIGRGVGVVYQFAALLGGAGRVNIKWRHVRLDQPVMVKLLRVSLTGMLQCLVATASWLGLVRIVALFGSSALAGYTVALRIVVTALLPSWGLSNAAATLVGQNLGAGRPDRAELSVWRTGLYNMIFLGAVALLFILFAEPGIRIFTQDPAVVPIGVSCLRFISYGYVFYAWGMVMVQAFNGAGDTWTPTVINLFCYWLWQIPLAYGLAMVAGLGENGVFLAIAISESTLAVVGMLMFRKGRWKSQKI